jgi:hypothetical protein
MAGEYTRLEMQSVRSMAVAIALLSAVVLIVLAGQRVQAWSESTRCGTAEEQQALRTLQAARDAQARVDQLARDLDALKREVSSTVASVTDAQSSDDRAVAYARLNEAREQLADLRARASRDIRARRIEINAACLDNPLAKDCL